MARSERRSSVWNGWFHSQRGAVSSKRRPSTTVAGDRPGLEQGLELPRLGPPVPVGLVALDRADEPAVAALGPQVEVDPEGLPGHGR